SRDGLLMGLSDYSLNAVVVDISTGAVKASWPAHTSECTGIAFSNDTRLVATCSIDKTVKIFDLQTRDQLQTIRSHGNKVFHVAFSPVNNLLASAGTEGIVCIHNPQTGELVQRLHGHAERIISLQFFADGRLMTCSRDGTVRIWDNVGQPDITQVSTSGACNGTAISPDGRTAVVRDLGGSLRLIDIPSGNVKKAIRVGESQRGVAIAISGDGSLFTFADGNDVVVMRMSDCSELARLKVHAQTVIRSVFSPDGSMIASTSFDATIRIFDLASGKVLHTLLPPSGAGQINLAFSADSSRLAAGGDEKLVYIWNVWSGNLERTLKGHDSAVFHMVWGRNDDTLITGGDDGHIMVWPTRSDAPPRKLLGHNGPVYSLGISADGSRLVSGGFDNTSRVWNMETGQELLTLRGHTSGIVCVAFSKDGNRLVTAGNDARLMIWDAPPADERAKKE
ncbi:MAG: WD40 repeat domain-containing protein, partial [Burkholderiales bacterium]|nr:WD40 repeat domain-containing protein [Phycisphaerae bacterium]